VDIGGALAEARSEAGMTITEVSERTRIRATIIRDIERDDYTACGGDFYARGHIRAIAKAVGTDPVPLIKEYDAAHLPPADAAEQQGSVPLAHFDPEANTDPNLFGGEALELPSWPKLRQSASHLLGEARSRLGAAAGPRDADGAVLGPPAPSGITAAEAFRPRMPLDFERRRPGRRRRGLLVLVALAIIGVVLYLLLSRGSPHGNAPPASRPHHGASAAALRSGGAAATGGRPASTTGPAAVGAIPVASAAAFGPGGTGTGDDPQDAHLAIDASAQTAWHTDWYATAQLGGLQSGTGLLLNLGRTASITTATIVLGPSSGGTIELRAGDTPALTDLPVVAQATDPGGALTVHLSSAVRARYLLIWFTSLPPDNSGTYQASIYNVHVAGTV
jgi:transcriptional regulator with XRE-family HTH domain